MKVQFDIKNENFKESEVFMKPTTNVVINHFEVYDKIVFGAMYTIIENDVITFKTINVPNVVIQKSSDKYNSNEITAAVIYATNYVLKKLVSNYRVFMTILSDKNSIDLIRNYNDGTPIDVTFLEPQRNEFEEVFDEFEYVVRKSRLYFNYYVPISPGEVYNYFSGYNFRFTKNDADIMWKLLLLIDYVMKMKIFVYADSYDFNKPKKETAKQEENEEKIVYRESYHDESDDELIDFIMSLNSDIS